MKTLNMFRLCLVGMLVIGLTLTWSAAAPQLIAGEDLEGGGCKCFNHYPVYCDSTGGQSCYKMHYQCDSGGDDRCYNVGPSGCYADVKCRNQQHELCG